MRYVCPAFATVALLFLSVSASAADKLNLKVLYAGNPVSTRAKDFVAFLEKYFSKVGSADFGKFQEKHAKDYDVVIFDWTSIYPRDKTGKLDNSVGNISMPPAPHLSQTFAKPAILIGAAGGQVAGSLQIKINWL